ncbi:MAG TPA: carboxylating nicotinate-nucleotide diphosphorylase [bacterium]|nr:carboxylating nicotinate-nucleotide diphosphorylase [bacterium]
MNNSDRFTKQIIRAALQEDLNKAGDLTTQAVIPESAQGTAVFIIRESGVLAGTHVVHTLFQMLGGADLGFSAVEGEKVEAGQNLGRISGSLRTILTGERTALNFLQRLSGIATLTSRYVEAVFGTRAVILDTRKTTPGMRSLEKAAVVSGGGRNHRHGLYDMILIKNNHIDAAGSVTEAVRRCVGGKRTLRDVPVEVETRTLKEVAEALELPVQRIMLDNMDYPVLKAAVKMIGGRKEVEVSGNMTLRNVRKIAKTGVDFISVGALTHSAPALDIALRIE